jgi:hypothetical protein
MPRYKSIDDILEEPDDLRLLEVKLKPRATRSSEDERNAAVVREVNAFFERTGRLPDPGGHDHDDMRLGVIWEKIVARADRDVVTTPLAPPA